jgi:hypothetical protein
VISLSQGLYLHRTTQHRKMAVFCVVAPCSLVATTQKTAIFVLTAMSTSNPTQHRKTRTNIHALNGIRTLDPVYERSRPAPQTALPLDRHTNSLLYNNINYTPYLPPFYQSVTLLFIPLHHPLYSTHNHSSSFTTKPGKTNTRNPSLHLPHVSKPIFCISSN